MDVFARDQNLIEIVKLVLCALKREERPLVVASYVCFLHASVSKQRVENTVYLMKEIAEACADLIINRFEINILSIHFYFV